MLTVGELCAGYGGLSLGLEAAGWPVRRAWVAETDPDAARVLEAHWPRVSNIGDITTADWAAVPQVDVVAAGVPCPGYSLAGRRRGRADERHLWPAAAACIAAVRPTWFFFENVPGLLTVEGGAVFGEVLVDLDDLGYEAVWTTVGACAVGACHHRHRVFLLARRGRGAQRHDLVPGAVAVRSGTTWCPARPDALFTTGPAGPVVWPAAGTMRGGVVWPAQPEPCGAPVRRATTARHDADGLFDLDSSEVEMMLPTPTAQDGLSGPGHAGEGAPNLRTAVTVLLPTCTARDADRGAGRPFAAGRPLSEVIALLPTPRASDAIRGSEPMLPSNRTGRGYGPALGDAVALLPTPRATDADKGGPNQRGSHGDPGLPAAVQPGRFGAYAAAVRRHELALSLPAPEPTEPGRTGRPRLAAPFAEWMQGLRHGHLTDVVERKPAIHLAGNGAIPQQVAYAVTLLAAVLPRELAAA